MSTEFVKCPICGKKVSKITTEKIGNRYYCVENCVTEYKNIQNEDKYRRAILEYLMKLCDYSEPSPVWLATLKKMHDERNLKYHGILLTLKYYFEKLNNPVKRKEEVLSIVEWYYVKAKEDYMDDRRIKKQAKEWADSGKVLLKRGAINANISTSVINNEQAKNIMLKNLNPVNLEEIKLDTIIESEGQ